MVGLLRGDDGRVLGVRVPGADGRRGPDPGRTHHRRGRYRIPRRARGRGTAPEPRQAASAILYRYVAQVPSTGYVWGYGDGAAAGLIPTNARRDVRVRVHHTRANACTPARGRRGCLRQPARRRPGSAGRRRTSGWRSRSPARLARNARTRPTLVRSRMGPGRRRRLLQGPDHHARAHRRTPRRGAVVGRCARRRSAALRPSSPWRTTRTPATGCRRLGRSDGVGLSLRLGRRPDPDAATRSELRDERRDGPSVRSSDAAARPCVSPWPLPAYLSTTCSRW